MTFKQAFIILGRLFCPWTAYPGRGKKKGPRTEVTMRISIRGTSVLKKRQSAVFQWHHRVIPTRGFQGSARPNNVSSTRLSIVTQYIKTMDQQDQSYLIPVSFFRHRKHPISNDLFSFENPSPVSSSFIKAAISLKVTEGFSTRKTLAILGFFPHEI